MLQLYIHIMCTGRFLLYMYNILHLDVAYLLWPVFLNIILISYWGGTLLLTLTSSEEVVYLVSRFLTGHWSLTMF